MEIQDMKTTGWQQELIDLQLPPRDIQASIDGKANYRVALGLSRLEL
jgi:hypothetical protein